MLEMAQGASMIVRKESKVVVKPCSHGGTSASIPHERDSLLQTGGPSDVSARTAGPSVARSPERRQSGRAYGTDGRRVKRWHVRSQRAPDHVKKGPDGKQGRSEILPGHVKEARDHFKVPLVGDASGASRGHDKAEKTS